MVDHLGSVTGTTNVTTGAIVQTSDYWGTCSAVQISRIRRNFDVQIAAKAVYMSFDRKSFNEMVWVAFAEHSTEFVVHIAREEIDKCDLLWAEFSALNSINRATEFYESYRQKLVVVANARDMHEVVHDPHCCKDLPSRVRLALLPYGMTFGPAYSPGEGVGADECGLCPQMGTFFSSLGNVLEAYAGTRSWPPQPIDTMSDSLAISERLAIFEAHKSGDLIAYYKENLNPYQLRVVAEYVYRDRQWNAYSRYWRECWEFETASE